MTKWSKIKTWPQSPAVHVNGGTRYTAAKTGEWVEVGACARVADSAHIGHHTCIGEHAHIAADAIVGRYVYIAAGSSVGRYVYIGAVARVGAGSRLDDGVAPVPLP